MGMRAILKGPRDENIVVMQKKINYMPFFDEFELYNMTFIIEMKHPNGHTVLKFVSFELSLSHFLRRL